MCRGKSVCQLMGENPRAWDRYSTLRPLDWFDDELEKFNYAVEKFINGSREESIGIIDQIRSREMQEWYIEHAQVAGGKRKNILKKPDPPKVSKQRKRMPGIKIERELNIRDGYRCRYCQRRILTKDFLNLFVEKLNYVGFQKGPGNINAHGIILIHSTVLDHITPHAFGGENSEDNLVTSCYPCNYGKAEFSLDQLAIENPMLRGPILDEWQGMQNLIVALKNKS